MATRDELRYALVELADRADQKSANPAAAYRRARLSADRPHRRSPLRVAALAAVVLALVLGLFALFGPGGDDDSTMVVTEPDPPSVLEAVPDGPGDGYSTAQPFGSVIAERERVEMEISDHEYTFCVDFVEFMLSRSDAETYCGCAAPEVASIAYDLGARSLSDWLDLTDARRGQIQGEAGQICPLPGDAEWPPTSTAP